MGIGHRDGKSTLPSHLCMGDAYACSRVRYAAREILRTFLRPEVKPRSYLETAEVLPVFRLEAYSDLVPRTTHEVQFRALAQETDTLPSINISLS
jgi:hypothetical protein